MKDWTMFVLLAATLASLILFIYAKRKGKDVRNAIVSAALMVVGSVIILVRERLGDVSGWIELALLASLVVILALAFWKMIAHFKAHLRGVGLLSRNEQRTVADDLRIAS